MSQYVSFETIISSYSYFLLYLSFAWLPVSLARVRNEAKYLLINFFECVSSHNTCSLCYGSYSHTDLYCLYCHVISPKNEKTKSSFVRCHQFYVVQLPNPLRIYDNFMVRVSVAAEFYVHISLCIRAW